MELRDIRYFLVLCEELHFTRAADRCGVSQPCISAAIRKIEAELGGVLFHRRPQPQLSELGRTVRPLWDEALRKVEHSVELALGQAQAGAVPSPPIAPASLDDVRQALERIATEPAPPLVEPPAPEERGDGDDHGNDPGNDHGNDDGSDHGNDHGNGDVILARLRDQRIVASCRAHSGWTRVTTLAQDDARLQPRSRPGWRAFRFGPVRKLAFAAVTVTLAAAVVFLFVRLAS